VGDVIVGLNGNDVRDTRDLRNQAGLIREGQKVTFSVLRDRKPADVLVTLAAPLPSVAATGIVPALAGSVFEDIDPTRPVRGATTGVTVRSVEGNSNAFRNGLREGDVILAINNRPVDTVAELERLARQADGTLAITVSRDGQAQLVLAR
jgi:S1-C subfamily serine protease